MSLQRENISHHLARETEEWGLRKRSIHTLPAILPPRIIAIIYLHIVIRLLTVIVAEMGIVSKPAGALVAPSAIHKVNAVLAVADNFFLGIALHDEYLVEVGHDFIPGSGCSVKGEFGWE